MSRVKVDWRTSSRESFNDFKGKNKSININFEDWKKIIYAFNEAFRDYILETGEKGRLPSGFGEFSINKKKRTPVKIKEGKEFINLPVDWKKTKEKGKIIYNFNFHTEGFFFGWKWFKSSARIKFNELWYFRANRISSRTLAHYLKIEKNYQHLYKEWKEY